MALNFNGSETVIPAGGNRFKKRPGTSDDVFNSGPSGSDNGSKRIRKSRFDDVNSQSKVDVDILESDMLFNLEEITERIKQAKALARSGQKSGEVGKHSSPQIKRTMGFLFDVKFTTEDIDEKFDKLITAVNSGGKISDVDIFSLKEDIGKLKRLTKDEMLINKMASKSQGGWRTVSYFEIDNLFDDEDEDLAEKLTRRFKTAESRAVGDFRRNNSNSRGRGFRGRGYRGGFNGGSSGHGNRGGFRGFNRDVEERQPDRSYNQSRLANMSCYKCNKTGHVIKDCPDWRK